MPIYLESERTLSSGDVHRTLAQHSCGEQQGTSRQGCDFLDGDLWDLAGSVEETDLTARLSPPQVIFSVPHNATPGSRSGANECLWDELIARYL